MVTLKTLGGKGGLQGARRRGLLAGFSVLALVLVTLGLAPHPVSRAVTGTRPDSSPAYVGVLTASGQLCTATLVRPWMAITAKHCGASDPVLKLGVMSESDSDPSKVFEVWKIVEHSSLDLEALYLKGSAPWDSSVTWGDGYEYDPASGQPLRAWGFGLNRGNDVSGLLFTADFPQTDPCPSGLASDQGDFCFTTTSSNSLCSGDSGGPVTQGNKIVGMATAVMRSNPNAPFDCADVVAAQAIAIPKVAGWLHDRSCEAAPPDVWPCT